MLLLLHIHDRPVLERPLDDIRLWRCVFDAALALRQRGPEVGKVGQLDEVPDGAERCFDHG